MGVRVGSIGGRWRIFSTSSDSRKWLGRILRRPQKRMGASHVVLGTLDPSDPTREGYRRVGDAVG